LQVYLATADKRKRSDRDIVAAVRPKLAGQFPGTTYTVQFGGIVSRILNFGAQSAIEVEQLGYDLKDAQRVAQDVTRVLQETPGIADAFVSREENYPQYDIVVDREKAAAAGVSQRDIAQAALFSLNSNVSVNPSIYTDPRTGNQYNAVVQLDEEFRSSPADLGRLFVTGDGGRPVLLGNLAEIRQGTGPVMIERKYQQRIIKISANPTGRDLGALSEDLEARFKQLPLPPGFSLQLGGQTVQQREAFGSLKFTTLLALVLVYMVMASQFRSLLDPFLIMFSVPLGMIGVIWALFLTNTTLNVTSFMGIIMMGGIVVSNGVLLVKYINERRRHGQELIPAVINGGRTRPRRRQRGQCPAGPRGDRRPRRLDRLHLDPHPHAVRHGGNALPASRGDTGHLAHPPRRNRMTSLASRFLAGLALAALLVPAPAMAQPTNADPMTPRQPLTAPGAIRPFPT